MKRNSVVVGGLVALVALSASISFAAKGISLEGVKCLMVGSKAASESKSSEYKDGKVFFCCSGCKGKFDKMSKADMKKLGPKANMQLVATKQYEQKACPFSGGDLNDDMKIKVGAAEVAFCCGNCKGKAEGMKGDKQIEALFGEKAFKTAKFTAVEETE